MRFSTSEKYLRSLTRIFLGTLALVLLTAACTRLQLNLATNSLLFLLVVVIQALGGGFISAIVLSLIATGLLGYYFVVPIHTWGIADPFDFVALATFLGTSLTITGLASKARAQARTADRQRKSLERLYQASQRLLWIGPEENVPARLLQTFKEVFGLRAACLFDGRTAESHFQGESARLAERTRRAYMMARDADDAIAGLSTRCLRTAGKLIGAIGFEGLGESDLTAGPLTALSMIALERAHVSRAASRAAAAAKTEVFRAAVLDALAHEFKTPLTAILTAAEGIEELGPLNVGQKELAHVIENESARLGRLTSRLLRTAELDREQVEPRLKLTDIRSLVGRLVKRFADRITHREISFVPGSRSACAMADEELFRLALTQLLDNAVKYSRPDSSIVVRLTTGGTTIGVQVWNDGISVPPAERELIFERFYRGVRTQDVTPGTGLGLYVARKIARAHGGTLDVDLEGNHGRGTAFLLTVPAALTRGEHANSANQSVSCR